MFKKAHVAGVIAAAFTFGSALAADLPSTKAPPYLPPPPPPPMWTGFYVGLNAGGTWSDNNSVNTISVPIVAGAAPFAALASGSVPVGQNGGFIGGGQVGYNWQFSNNFVAGLEADIQGVAHSGNSGSGATMLFPLVTQLTSTKTLDYLGTVRGRLGYLVTPTLLAYGTGGLAYGGVSSSTSIAQTFLGILPFGFGSSSFSDTRVGWTAGGGLEWMFSPNWSAKAEYLYYDLGNVNYSGGLILITGMPYAAPQSTTRFSGHIVRAGLNYHFNWGAPAPVVAAY